ncbi:uncharacterized protein A4U43_C04F2150 [Asparagus officinalis]|uniref:Protein kinase domain-containing protein n=1 Tax=Asparagus officinalis TaxID=4686 RepID=A0A5P1EXK2_ASPOF|nr:receptor-like serine/threonine-protein kinase ALE2 [Asparagus officinalis]ONK70848.1 uncharacterized protein A4U43_C04F2150 [Asparagus officinalis]
MNVILILISLCLVPSASARQTPTGLATVPSVLPKVSMISSAPAQAPAYSPERHSLTPAPSPAISPETHGHFRRHYGSKHHKSIPHAVPSPSFTPLQDPGCDEVSCDEPLTLTPIGSPCGCILPMQVKVDFDVAPYQLFSRTAELEVEVADGTFLKQSQVRIMGASASIEYPGKTTVTIDLVPLGEKFDNMTALLTYERFWQKKIPINTTVFGDYTVIYVQYPGLPSTPPSMSASLGPSGIGDNRDPFTANVPHSKTQKMNPKIIAVIALFSLLLVLIGFVAICIFWRCKKLGRASTVIGPAFTSSVVRKTGIRSIISSSATSFASISSISTMVPCPSSVRTFSIAELEKATDKFSSRKVIGEGGFGRVYLGILNDGSEVAIKLLMREDTGDREFIAEVEMLSRLHHRNLVKLIGICIEGHKRCLIYELIRNGSVESHLHGNDKMKAPLDWDARMKIALGAARGLAYLHEDSNPRVIHRDFKASNVLLEEDFTPKVSDFGLAREASEGTHHISTRVMGTFGYVAPEYAMTGHLLVKSDVYSYGVVLLELLSGRKPVDISQPHGSENLVTWARPLLTTKEGLEQLIDSSLGPSYDIDTMAKVAAIASLCVHIEASQRPFMGEVVQALKLIYNDVDETCEDSCSQRESSSGHGPEGSWWNGSSPHFVDNYNTMEYSSGYVEGLQRPHSESLAGGYNRSGPLRTKKQKSDFYRLRGSVSEHGHQQYRRSCYDGSWI